MGVRAVYWLMVALVATPALLLAVAWVLSFREGKGKLWRSGWVLPIATGSVSWAIIAWNMPPALGPTYSNVRYAIIDCNFLAMLGCSIFALRSKAAKAKVAGVACVAATVLWGLVAAVNSIA